MDASLSADVLPTPDQKWSGVTFSDASPQPRIFTFAAGLLVIVHDATLASSPGSLAVQVDGHTVPAPVTALRLTEGSLSLQIIMARRSAVLRAPGADESFLVEVFRDSTMDFAGYADRASGSGNVIDFGAFVGGLPLGMQASLLYALVGACTNIFKIEPGHQLVREALRLASSNAPDRSAGPSAQALSATADPLSVWAVPGSYAAGSWYLLTARSTRRIAAPVAGVFVLDEPLRPSETTLLLPPGRPGHHAPKPLLLRAGPASLPRLLESVPGREAAERALAAALARRVAAEPGNSKLKQLLRDRRLLAPLVPAQVLDNPARPVGAALEIAVSDGEGGVFIGGWMRDPFHMVTGGLALRDPLTGLRQEVPKAITKWHARPDLAERLSKTLHGTADSNPGFLAHLPDLERLTGGPVAQWGLDLQLRSGEAISLGAPPSLLPPVSARDLVLRAVHPAALRHDLLDDCIIPAVARLQRGVLAPIGAPDVVQIGDPPRKPRVNVIIPLYKNLRFLRFQIAAFAQDASFRADASLLFVLDSPEQRAELEHLLRGLYGIYDLPATMVVMPVNAGYASANNAGVLASDPSAKAVLLLNSDVIPCAPGWLRAMLRSLERDDRTCAVGPKLLFEDGSVQHAGLFFAREGAQGDWLNGHYGKGMPRRFPSVERAGEVPGVTGASLLVRRDAFDAAGGLCADYVVGDYEDSDLCLRLRALGGTIRYAPEAELYHFERQSIVGHGGYARTLACAHNRRIHHLRWDTAISALMNQFSGDGAQRPKR